MAERQSVIILMMIEIDNVGKYITSYSGGGKQFPIGSSIEDSGGWWKGEMRIEGGRDELLLFSQSDHLEMSHTYCLRLDQ